MSQIPKTMVLILVAAMALTLVAAGALTYTHRIGNNAGLKAIGVAFYQDQQCTISLTQIEWGLINKGETSNKTFYCKNTQNVPVTMMLAAVDFDPSTAEPYVTSSWNYTSQTLNPGQVIPIQFSLTIAPDFPNFGTFSFVTLITAVEKTV